MTEMKLKILIASHLNEPLRHETIKDALTSIKNNTEPPEHVYISCSYKIKPNIEEWSKILKNIPHTIILQEKRMLQFQHYHYLSKYIEDDDIVCFLDDDDLYYPNKIKTIKYLFKNYLLNQNEEPIKFIRHKSKVFFGNDASKTYDCTLDEYFTLNIIGRCFKAFFEDNFLDGLEGLEGLETFEKILIKHQCATEGLLTLRK